MKRRYRIDDVPHVGAGSWQLDLRAQFSVEPVNVERSRWSWRVWLEFQTEWEGVRSWRPSPVGYDCGGGPHQIGGVERTQEAADLRVRECIEDVRRRRAENEALAMARSSGGHTGSVPV